MRPSSLWCGVSSAPSRLERLCVAGGVALNCVTNELIRQASAFSDIFIPSGAA